jgi:hypothetical protein
MKSKTFALLVELPVSLSTNHHFGYLTDWNSVQLQREGLHLWWLVGLARLSEPHWTEYDLNTSITSSSLPLTKADNHLRTIDVSKSFQISADVETYVKRTPLPDTMPRDTYSTMWPIAKDTLASFFGFHEVSHIGFDRKDPAITTVQPLDAKLTLDTTTNSWTIGRVKSTRNFKLLDAGKDKAGAVLKIGSQMSTWVPSLRRGYYLGGATYKDAPDLVWDAPRGFTNHRGMIVYDADSDTLSNQTMPYPQGSDGQLLHLTTKDDEILINFGGNSQPSGATLQTVSCPAPFILTTVTD